VGEASVDHGPAGEGLGASRSAFLEAGHTLLSPVRAEFGRGGGRRRRRSGRVLVVLRPAEVLMSGEQKRQRARRPREPIEAVFEDRVDVAVGAGVDAAGAGARCLEPVRAIALRQAQDAEAGAVALLGVRPADERDEEIHRLRAKVGEITMHNELLLDRCHRLEGGLPLASRRRGE